MSGSCQQFAKYRIGFPPSRTLSSYIVHLQVLVLKLDLIEILLRSLGKVGLEAAGSSDFNNFTDIYPSQQA